VARGGDRVLVDNATVEQGEMLVRVRGRIQGSTHGFDASRVDLFSSHLRMYDEMARDLLGLCSYQSNMIWPIWSSGSRVPRAYLSSAQSHVDSSSRPSPTGPGHDGWCVHLLPLLLLCYRVACEKLGDDQVDGDVDDDVVDEIQHLMNCIKS
jgi:hypothetical protein